MAARDNRASGGITAKQARFPSESTMAGARPTRPSSPASDDDSADHEPDREYRVESERRVRALHELRRLTAHLTPCTAWYPLAGAA